MKSLPRTPALLCLCLSTMFGLSLTAGTGTAPSALPVIPVSGAITASGSSQEDIDAWLDAHTQAAEDFLVEHRELLNKISLETLQVAQAGGYDFLDIQFDEGGTAQAECRAYTYSGPSYTIHTAAPVPVSTLSPGLDVALAELNEFLPVSLHCEDWDSPVSPGNWRISLNFSGEQFSDALISTATVSLLYPSESGEWYVSTDCFAMAGL